MSSSERPLTVLQFGMTYAPRWSDGGPPRIMYDYARHLLLEGFQVMVLTGDNNRPKPEDDWAGFPPGLEVHYLRKLGGWRGQYYFDFSWKELTDFFDRHWWKIDFIHLYQSRSIFNVAALWAARKYGIKVVLSSFGSMPRRGSVGKYLYDNLFVLPLTRRTELLLAQTRNEAEVYRRYGGRADKIHLLPLAVDLSKLPSATAGLRREFRGRYQIPEQARLFLFLGRLHPTKGVEFLVRCFGRVVQDTRDAYLAIVGHDQGSAAAVNQEIARQGLQSRVVLCGPLYDNARWQAYAAADCFVIFPEIFEETSLASLEALACGTPVITNERADVPWLEKYGAGKVVRAGDADAAVAAMQSFGRLGDPALARYRAGADRLIREKFSIEAVSSQFAGLLRRSAAAETKHKRGPLLIGPLPGVSETSGQAVCFKLLVEGLEAQGLDGPVVNLGSGITNQSGHASIGRALEYVSIFAKVARHSLLQPRLVYVTMAQSRQGFFRDAVIIAMARLSGNEVVLHLNGGNFDNYYRSESTFLKWAIRTALRRTRSIIVLSEGLRDCFGFDHILRDRTTVVRNSLPLAEMPDRPIAKTVRPDGPIRLLYLSNLIESKGYLEVLEVLHHLRLKEGLPARVEFCGKFLANRSDDVRVRDAEHARQLFEERAAELGVREFVSYRGTVGGSEKSQIFAESDFLIFPTRYDNEGQPVVLIEALAYGLPSITTNYRANPDMVIDGTTGCLVDWNDTPLMAKKIAALWRNPEEYTRMSTQARQHFERCFIPEAHITSMKHVLFSSHA